MQKEAGEARGINCAQKIKFREMAGRAASGYSSQAYAPHHTCPPWPFFFLANRRIMDLANMLFGFFKTQEGNDEGAAGAATAPSVGDEGVSIFFLYHLAISD